MPQIGTGEGNIAFHCEWDNLNRTTTNVHGNTIINSSGGIMLTNMLTIVQVIDTSMVWPCHEERGRVNVQGCDAVKGEWKETKRRPILMWLDNIDRHQKGKTTSLKEVLRTKCFEKRQYWRTLISRSTDRNSGEDPGALPWSVVISEHYSPLLQIMIQCTILRCKRTFDYDTYDSSACILEPTASSWFMDRGLHLCNV